MVHALAAASFFLVGAVIGSFLNVCIYRLPRRETVVWGSSYCPRCGAKLRGWELLPVLGYLALRGRCRSCSARISPRYPAVELLTGFIFLLTFLQLGPDPLLVKYLFAFALLVVISFIDLDHSIIPNRLVLVFLVWAAFWQLALPERGFYEALGGALLGGGLLFLIAVASRGNMGGGDVKLMFAAGLFLGLPLTAVALFVAFLAGGAAGLALIATRRRRLKEPMPFGPFLCLGTFTAALWGQKMADLYLSLL